MRDVLSFLRPASVLLILLTVITGLAYPFVVTGIAQLAFPHQAGGSLIVEGGQVRGSDIIGQAFSSDRYFYGRPSAAGSGYDAGASSGSNLGPTSAALLERIKTDLAKWQAENPGKPVPIDLLTASGSGLDPHISPAAAQFQVPRVARVRGMSERDVEQLMQDATEGRTLGILGEPRVNVLKLNRQLDLNDQHRPEKRPSPDALLAEAVRESRGKLKIFLGAAPGVGKTYEMLVSARNKRQDGSDIVIGIVETHGRRETEALVQGFETIPRRSIPYHGQTLTEMDIDAILARKPKLVLVDELAHTNAPGSRHPKRHLDVGELLEAGIDVYSTLNVQHLESINDVVAKITHVRVRETVPDHVLDRADAIEVVDLTPEELIERLHAGKVYVPDDAQRALKHFFSPGNLTALRELALRRAAKRVDEQMLAYMRAHAIEGPWAAGERVVVCISEHPGAVNLVRSAKRLADALHAPWTALYIEGPRHPHLSDHDKATVAETLRFAQQLGGETQSISGDRISEALLEFAREHNVTQVVIGKTRRTWLFRLINGSIVDDLIALGRDIAVHVLPFGAGDPQQQSTQTRPAARPIELLHYIYTTVMVVGALGVSVLLQRVLDLSDLSLVFLLPVLVSATSYGLWPALLASFLGVLAYNFFFLPPIYTLVVADPQNIITLAAYLITALITTQLTARVRRQIQTVRSRERTNAQLFGFSRKLTAIAEIDDLLWAASAQVAQMLRLNVVILLPQGDELQVRAGYPPEDQLEASDLAAAQWAWDHSRITGRDSDTLPGGTWLFLPMRTGRGRIGILGVTRHSSGPMMTPDESRLLDAIIDQTALAIERCLLADEMDDVRVLAATEKLRSALLSSISHDLRTPLASVIGAVTSLRAYWRKFSDQEREDLMATIQEEGERMNRFIANLLDMTRIESGTLAVKVQPTDLKEVIATTLKDAQRIVVHHKVDVLVPSGLPMLRVDPTLLEQVLLNLLDNAAKFAPRGSTITLRAMRKAGIALAVEDEGSGIPREELLMIFEKFYRVQGSDRDRVGTGLGLAICKGFVEAMGGAISAGNSERGAIFTLRFPSSLEIDAEAVKVE